MHAREVANQSAQAGTITRLKTIWYLRFEQLTTTHTVPLVQLEVRDLHLDWGQFDYLVCMVRHRGHKPTMATLTSRRRNDSDFSGLKQNRSRAPMALASPTFAGRAPFTCRILSLGFVERRIRRGWLTRRLGGLIHAPLKLIDLDLKLLALLLEMYAFTGGAGVM
jgi:hypothetical protein